MLVLYGLPKGQYLASLTTTSPILIHKNRTIFPRNANEINLSGKPMKLKAKLNTRTCRTLRDASSLVITRGITRGTTWTRHVLCFPARTNQNVVIKTRHGSGTCDVIWVRARGYWVARVWAFLEHTQPIRSREMKTHCLDTASRPIKLQKSTIFPPHVIFVQSCQTKRVLHFLRSQFRWILVVCPLRALSLPFYTKHGRGNSWA